MWFHLDLDGIDFHFRISKYRKSIQDIWDEQWCKVDLTLQSGSTIEFSVADLVSGLQSEITSNNKLSLVGINIDASVKLSRSFLYFKK